MIAITVDVGTISSRIKIIKDHEICAIASPRVGIKDVAITGSQDVLKSELARIIFEGLEKRYRVYYRIQRK